MPPKPRPSLALGLVYGSKERPAYFQPALLIIGHLQEESSLEMQLAS